MALLSVLCSLSSAFFGIMRSSVDLVARIVIYVDECTPGNVLRHDLGRLHVLCSNGLACTEIAFVMHNLMAIGITLDVLKEYACDYTLPRALGTVKGMWFDDSHLKADTIQAFASEVLAMVPLIYAFIIDVVAKIKDCPLLKHIECFGYLNSIIGLLRQGPENE